MKIVEIITNSNFVPTAYTALPEFIINNKQAQSPCNMREIDDKFVQLQRIRQIKKDFLLANQKKIKEISQQNEFLEGVKNDYCKYNNYILQQKKDQIRALELLNEYIKDLNDSGILSEQNIKDSKEEQKKILREIKTIKYSLDTLIGETDDIHNNSL